MLSKQMSPLLLLLCSWVSKGEEGVTSLVSFLGTTRALQAGSWDPLVWNFWRYICVFLLVSLAVVTLYLGKLSPFPHAR